MKADFVLLGTMGAAILAVPVAVMLWFGQDLATGTTPAGASYSASLPVFQNSEVSQDESSTGRVEQQSSSNPDGGSLGSAAPDTESAGVYQTDISSFRILNKTTGKVDAISLEDYVRGAIAAEMPASFHTEALKAQGVAALSYALFQASTQRANPSDWLQGADFEADPINRKVYMTETQARDFYGDSFEYLWEKICDAADEACQWVLTYDNEPVAAAYHAISAGSTEAAVNIWGNPLPYLVEADSSWDEVAEGYQTTAAFGQEELRAILAAEGIVLGSDPKSWIVIEERSSAGYVTSVRVGDQSMHGNTLRNLLGLRSACFEISYQGQQFVFTVKGYGHGAGLSQNGADYLARQGKSFQDILAHYYVGAELMQLEK